MIQSREFGVQILNEMESVVHPLCSHDEERNFENDTSKHRKRL